VEQPRRRSARLCASSAACVANPVFSCAAAPSVSRPHSRLVRLTSVTVGSAATPTSGCPTSLGTISAQPWLALRANSSRKMLVLTHPSPAAGRMAAAIGASTCSSTDSTGTRRPSMDGCSRSTHQRLGERLGELVPRAISASRHAP
jgi:hypothetical protein